MHCRCTPAESNSRESYFLCCVLRVLCFVCRNRCVVFMLVALAMVLCHGTDGMDVSYGFCASQILH